MDWLTWFRWFAGDLLPVIVGLGFGVGCVLGLSLDCDFDCCLWVPGYLRSLWVGIIYLWLSW